jgi:hypothetical protein
MDDGHGNSQTQKNLGTMPNCGFLCAKTKPRDWQEKYDECYLKLSPN